MVLLGAYSATLPAAVPTMSAFVRRRSIRSIPGFRGIPAVMTTTSLSAIVGDSRWIPGWFTPYFLRGAAWEKSIPLAWGMPSTTSIMTMSAMFFSAT